MWRASNPSSAAIAPAKNPPEKITSRVITVADFMKGIFPHQEGINV
jgi:hypothetical protein